MSGCQLTAPLEEAWRSDAFVRAGGLSAPDCLVVELGDFVCALDPASGEPLWSYPWRSRLCAIRGETVLAWVGPDELHALDLRSGRALDVIHCPAPFTPLHAQLAGDVLLVWLNMTEHTPSRLVAVDLGARRRLWSVPAADTYVRGTSDDCFTADLGLREKAVRAGFDARTGEELWRAPGDWGEPVPVLGGAAIGRTGGELLAQDLKSGEILWRGESIPSPILLCGDRLYSCDRGDYRIVDATSGRLLRRWDLTARLPKSLRSVLPATPILVSETHLFASTTRRNTMLAFTRDEAEYVCRFAADGNLACRDGLLFVSRGRNLTCLRPRARKGRKKR